MARQRHTTEQVIHELREVDLPHGAWPDRPVPDTCRRGAREGSAPLSGYLLTVIVVPLLSPSGS